MSVEEDIIEWALSRPGWQQRVLVHLANGQEYSEADIRHLVDEIVTGTSSAPSREAEGLILRASTPASVSLARVKVVSNVNALPDSEVLDFAPTGLTVIFGANGSGKSGFARLIKSVVNARHASDILPDAFEGHTGVPSAELEFLVDGTPFSETLSAAPNSDTRKVSFYDEHCGDAYISREASVTYRPSALTVLDGLVAVCDAARQELQRRIVACEGQKLKISIDSSTVAGAFFASMSSATTEQAIEAATTMPANADQQRANLTLEDARLRATDPVKEQTRLRAQATQIRQLSEHIGRLNAILGADAQSRLNEARTRARDLREAATVAMARNRDESDLPGVGAGSWRKLWEVARAYSVELAYPEHAFPHVGDSARCVLCQQELDADAAARLERFERYMVDTTEQDARASERDFNRLVEMLRSTITVTATSTASLTTLVETDEKLGAAAQELMASLELQRTSLLAHVESGEAAPRPLVPSHLVAQLNDVTVSLSERADSTDADGFTARLSVVTKQLKEAEALEALAGSADDLKLEAARLRRERLLKDARSKTDTSGITVKSSQLARTYATALILDQFTRETDRLRLTRVTLQDLGGKKGQLNQRPGLLGAQLSSASAMSVLSEGEQTALGLSGFFTEAFFDASKSALVLDDPVTSLDHVRRENVAQRLVQFAADRQVIVFSHEISFVGSLVKAAEMATVPVTSRCVERLGGIKPGRVRADLPWRAKDYPARKGVLEADLARLTRERPTLGDSDYEKRVAEWAGNLSETWERCVSTEVLNKLFDTGKSEVRPMAFRLLSKITEEDNDDFQHGYGASSTWSRRHDNAPITNYVPPEPDELRRELERLIRWQKRLKSYLS